MNQFINMNFSNQEFKIVSYLQKISLLIALFIFTSCNFGFSYITSLQQETVPQPNQIKIELAPDGTGDEIQSVSLFVGDTYNFYSVLRSSNGEFTENISADWNLSGNAGSLLVNVDGKSVVFNALSAGQSHLIVSQNGIASNFTINVSALPNLVQSSTKTTSNASLSYVDMVVDWDRSIAYVASRKPNICVEAIDFSNPTAPTVFGTIGSGTLQGCIGVALFDNASKLIVSANTNRIAVWNLTSNPFNTGSWASMGELFIGHGSKRFAGLVSTGTNQWDIYLATRYNGRKISLSIAGPAATLTNLFTYAPGGGIEFNSAILLGNKMLIQSYTGAAQPIVELNSNMTVSSSRVTSFFNWTADSNAAGNKAFVGADGGAFFGLDEFSNPVEHKRFTMGCFVRSSNFAVQNSKEYLYALCTSGKIYQFDVTDIQNPTLVKTGQLTSFENEAYTIRVKPNSNDAIVVTNGGDFLHINLQGLNATNTTLTLSP